MKNIEKAKALIESFATGDTNVAKEILTEGYIQHNLLYGTGRDAFISSVEYLASAPEKTTVENIRAYEDGDYVFMQTIYNFAGVGKQVAFDIFRFENGKIAEHWDNLAQFAPENPSGHTQTDGPVDVVDIG
ncbi:MAG: nuclear transport factor 2 family protein, partial [Peptostreptococcaceae bacterium]